MYQAHWGLQDSPFRGNLDPKTYHQSPTHEEALARLSFLVGQHRRLGLLVGPSGSGKSLLLEVFAQQLRRAGRKGLSSQPQVAKLSLLDVEPTEMLWLLACQWGLSPAPTASAAALWRAIGDRLFVYRCQQWEAVVLLDDAHRADPQVMQHVTRLARFDPSPDMWLTIVLAGRNESMARLGESLLGLAALRIELEPWERSETEEFVTALLVQAGQCGPVFDRPAVDRLHELAHGIPRRVCQLADLALLAGAGRNLDQIDAGVVETVYQELGAV
jgi:type II secretory pathway predicted ATPase ExeA